MTVPLPAPAVLPCASRFITELAACHGVRYVPLASDRLARAITLLSDAEPEPDPLAELLLALRRAQLVDAAEHARLSVELLRERHGRP